MNRGVLALAGAMILVGGLVYAWSARGTDHPPAPATALPPASVAPEPKPAAAPVTDAGTSPQTQEPSAGQVTAWVNDTQSDDAPRRAAAITGLARAPRAVAIPVLRQVLATGETTIDRPMALKSLAQIALEQGDDDGAARNVIREAIYHGDGGEIGGLAQDALDTVEHELAQRPAAIPHG